ncbi:MAG: hypothetical protein DRJ06_06495 [Candidatus Aminicenantes bacterium]|nr:MAG: hypothetical protein DRJ06_06495 [Candidatus Aminicenantes bacterium]
MAALVYPTREIRIVQDGHLKISRYVGYIFSIKFATKVYQERKNSFWLLGKAPTHVGERDKISKSQGIVLKNKKSA